MTFLCDHINNILAIKGTMLRPERNRRIKIGDLNVKICEQAPGCGAKCDTIHQDSQWSINYFKLERTTSLISVERETLTTVKLSLTSLHAQTCAGLTHARSV